MKVLARIAGVLALAWTASADEWLQHVTIQMEPPDDGQQIVNVCLRPARSLAYDQVVFECVYRQQFAWTDTEGRRTIKTCEPVAFTYRRAPAVLVADLDCNISFRVPVSHDRLADAFGASTFTTNAPIRINRLRIRGEKDGRALWQQERAAPGDYAIPERATPPAASPADGKPPPQAAKFGSVDLD